MPRNEHRDSETITLVSDSRGWWWRCTCGRSDQARRPDKGFAVISARSHGQKKHSTYGYEIKEEYKND